jgi:hypothetical protein
MFLYYRVRKGVIRIQQSNSFSRYILPDQKALDGLILWDGLGSGGASIYNIKYTINNVLTILISMKCFTRTKKKTTRDGNTFPSSRHEGFIDHRNLPHTIDVTTSVLVTTMISSLDSHLCSLLD